MTLQALVARMEALGRARRSAHEYYSEFLDDEDDIIRVGAWCALLDRQELHFSQNEQLVALARYAAIRTRAFVFLQSRWEHELAAGVAHAEPTAASEAEAERLLARARLSGEPEAFVAAMRMQYLATGRDAALHELLQSVQRNTPVALALPYAARGMLIKPHDPRMAEVLLVLLQRSGAQEQLKRALGHFEAAGLHSGLAAAMRARGR